MSDTQESTSKRVYVWVAILVIVCGLYVTFFTDLIFPPPLDVRAADLDELRTDEAYPIPLIVFALDDSVGLTSLRVVKLDESGDGPVVWHLVGDPRSIEINQFTYGSTITGMQPPASAATRERLERGQTYRLELRSGRRRGSVEFGA